MNVKKILFAVVCLSLANGVSAQKSNPFFFEASYVGDVLGNFSGGIKTGATYLGAANIGVGFSTEQAGWWRGGQAFVRFLNTHGGEPTATLIGDFQVVSNIEAGNRSLLYELWFQQCFGRFAFIAGLQDLNAHFAASETAGLFLNSSFGIPGTITGNIPAPVFPLTGLGIDLHWDMADDWFWHTAIYDGTPDEYNAYNTAWNLSAKDGFLVITELQVSKSVIKNRSGKYQIGGYYHQAAGEEGGTEYNGGVYIVADQEVSDNFALFLQAGWSPTKNDNSQYYGLGVSWKNFSEKRPDDVLGFAVNHAVMGENKAVGETILELTYNFQLNKNIYLRPDIQYVINPAGTDQKLNNALVGTVRFGVEF